MSTSRTLSVLAAALAAAAVLPAQTTVVLQPVKDNTLIQEPNGNLSNGAGPHVFAGVTAVGRTLRGVMAFDVASMVPAGSTIQSVDLQLHMSMTISGAVSISLHKLTADWGEGTSTPIFGGGGGGAGGPSTTGDATWIHRFYNTVLWNTPGGDFTSGASATQSVSVVGFYNWSSPQMVADVQGWLDNPSTSYGWLLKSPETGTTTTKRFGSKDNTNNSMRPHLTITFTAPVAASLNPVGSGCAASSPVPLALAGNGLPVLGSQTFALDVSGGPAGAQAFLWGAAATVSNPLALNGGCTVYLDLPSMLALFNLGLSPQGPVTLSGGGAGSFPFPIPNDPSLAGGILAVQALALDPQAPDGFVLSNALEMTLGL